MAACLILRRPAFDEAAAASYELGDAEYAANEVEATWVTSLLGILVACLQWLQPMLTPGNFDALVASLLDKARFSPAASVAWWEQSAGPACWARWWWDCSGSSRCCA